MSTVLNKKERIEEVSGGQYRAPVDAAAVLGIAVPEFLKLAQMHDVEFQRRSEPYTEEEFAGIPLTRERLDAWTTRGVGDGQSEEEIAGLLGLSAEDHLAACNEHNVDSPSVRQEKAAQPVRSSGGKSTADQALWLAIIGIFCLGIILEPIAIAKALIAKNPGMGGEGRATAALVIAIIVLGLWVLGLIARFAG